MLPIDQLQQPLLYKVLNKMKNAQLCRMRRTCKRMDEFCERNKGIFAARRIDDGTITLTSVVYNHDGERARPSCYEDMAISSNNFNRTINNSRTLKYFNGKQLSGLAINDFEMSHLPDRANVVKKIMKLISDFPVVGDAQIKHTDSKLMCKISEIIQSRKGFEFSGFDDEDPYDIIDNLNKGTKRHTFSVIIDTDEPLEAQGLFERVKHFCEFAVRCETFGVQDFLEEMFFSQDTGSMKRIDIRFTDDHWLPVHYTEHGARLTQLWAPHLRRKFVTKDIEVPLSINYARLGKKYAVLLEYARSINQYTVTVLLVKEASNIWPSVFNTLEMDPTLEKEFLETEEEHKARKLKELFIEKMKSPDETPAVVEEPVIVIDDDDDVIIIDD